MTLFRNTHGLYRALCAALLVSALAFSGAGLLATPASAAVSKNCSTSTALVDRPALMYGDRGTCVSVLQQNLLNRGYKLGITKPTGAFLTSTKAAVIAFQRAHKLVPDGVVGPITWGRLGKSYTKPQPAPSPIGSSTTYNPRRGPNTTNAVVLSYDDCPKSYASFQATVLAAEKLDIALWLFPTGNCITSGKFSPAYARAHGHFVFNHSISHPDLRTLSLAGVKRQLGAPGVVTNYGRPPYGASNATVLAGYKTVGMQPVIWTKDTNDWRGYSQATVVNYVIKTSVKGDNILMHLQWNAFNPSAVSQMKAGINKKGLTVCPNYDGTTPVRPVASKICK